MKLRPTAATMFFELKGNFRQPHLRDTEPTKPHLLNSSLSENFVRWLLICAFVLACLFALLSTSGLMPAQGGTQLTTAVETASPVTPGDQLAGERQIQSYSAWLQAAHASAAVHGQDAALPSQF